MIVCAVAVVYANGLAAPFLWDDQTAILDNPSIRSLRPPWGALAAPLDTPVSRRPLVNLTFALNYGLHGYDVRGYHLVNLGVHALNACLLFAVVRRTLLTDSTPGPVRGHAPLVALAAALWWALHPVASEIVNYTTQRTTALAALFVLLTLYAAQRALDDGRGRRWQAAAIAASVCGVAAKEFAALAPLVVVLHDRAFTFGSFRQAFAARGRFYGRLALSWPLLAAILLLRPHATIGFSASIDPWTYALNQAGMVLRYLRLAVWPDALVLDYGVPRTVALDEVWTSVLAVALLVAATAVALFRWPKVGFPCAAFFLLLAPTSSVVPIATEVGSERRMYLPLAALAALLAVAGWRLFERLSRLASPRRRLLVTGGCAAIAIAWVAALAVRTVQRNDEFATPVGLWGSSVERWPHGRARTSYAAALVDAQQRESAIEQLRLAVADFPDARFALGTELAADGRYAEAGRELAAFIAAEPHGPGRFAARMLLGRILVEQRRFDEAIVEYRALAGSHPSESEPLVRLAHALAAGGRAAEAAAAYRQALALDSRLHAAHVGLAELLLDAGQIEEGIVHARAAVTLNPGSAPAQNLLGAGLAMDGRLAEAVVHFREAVALAPQNSEARGNLARAEARLAARRQVRP